MAGSYNHCVDDRGRLRGPVALAGMLENGGDVYEAVEELYGMVWDLAEGNPEAVEQARLHYQRGLQFSPGVAPDRD